MVYPTMRTQGSDVPSMRPMSRELLAQHLVAERWARNAGIHRYGPINLMASYGGFTSAQAIANATRRDVFASYCKVGDGRTGFTLEAIYATVGGVERIGMK